MNFSSHISGVGFVISPLALESTQEPAKIHTQTGRLFCTASYHRRVQKKWVKRWGYVQRPCVFQSEQGLIVHPEVMKQIEAATDRAAVKIRSRVEDRLSQVIRGDAP